MTVIYLDVLLAMNLLVDYLLLAASAYLLHRPIKRIRLLLAAGLGAAFSCVIFLPPLPVAVTILLRLVSGGLLVKIAFPWRGWRDFFTIGGVFIGASALFTGVVFGLWTWLAPPAMVMVNGVLYYDIPAGWLVGFSVISYGLLRLSDRLFRKKVPQGILYRLRIDGGAGLVELNALCDTGLQVTEQFSGAPVAIVQYDAIRSCLTANLQQALTGLMMGQGDDLAVHAALRNRLRMIPFHSIGGEGILPAFCPVAMTLSDGNGAETAVDGTYVAVSRQLQSREYQALIGCALAECLQQQEGGINGEPVYPKR